MESTGWKDYYERSQSNSDEIKKQLRKEKKMRKSKKIVSLLLASLMATSMFAGCSSDNNVDDVNESNSSQEEKELTPEEYYGVADWESQENVIDDNYRNYYQIFVYSFADSDGDGIGDINGITSKLDYLEELGINGIWLSPIHQSTTYHKYDVVDYYTIDKEYGTMEDFENFMAECDKRGIKVILDLVFNHTSAKHEWFTTASKYLRSLEAGQEPDLNECPYVGYYNFVKSSDASGSVYYKITNSEYSYEGQFWDQMPDLNLANEALRTEIENIAKFWIDKGVGGFRLDAAKEFYTGNVQKNVEVLKWFTDYIKSVDENLYLVAEVWDNHATITNYYKSGITSIFDYCYGDASGYIMKALNSGTSETCGKTLAERFVSTQNDYLEANPDMINAPFLSNHDCGRIGGFAQRKLEKMKMAAALNLFMSGSSFTYYGEEIGMVGAGIDENKRAPMYWSDFAGAEGICTGPAAMEDFDQEFESLESQMKDTYSIYWYYRNAFHIKSVYPEIARGLVENVEVEDGKVCAIKKTYNGETIYLLFNLGNEETTVTLSKDKYSYEGLVASLEIDENKVKMEGESVTLPAYGVAVIK